ncbi:hypothetical protein [Paenibacillus sp. FSL R7-269]|uniref:hypothetical protein n=1 Tax=Paenibacillus sp. FSL R7-269 TaxID=1226755 RepID=UPI0012EB1EA9|nr:hypothetical protein [Paenibacillus sp. FSL R7-269]
MKKEESRVDLYAVITAVLLLIISFFTEKVFSDNIASYKGYISSKIVYFFICYFSARFLIFFFRGIKNPFKKAWTINLLCIFIPLFVWLLLSWPGIFTWDEFWVFEAATYFNIENWQSYITSYFYIISMYFFPSAGAIVFIEIIVMSFAASWIITKLQYQFNIKLIRFFLLFFLAVWPPIIFSTLITFRSTMLAIFELWLIGYIYFALSEKTVEKSKLFLLAFLTIILSTWRIEGIYHSVIIPLFLFIKYGINKGMRKRLVYFSVFVILGTLLVNKGYDLIKRDNYVKMKYELTAFMNPLSIILTDKSVDISNTNMEVIDKVIDVEKTKAEPDFYETPSFWNGAVREGFTKKDFNSFKKEYVKLVTLNADIFLSARTRTFVASSGFSPHAYYVNDYINNFINNKPENKAAEFFLEKPLNYPLSLKIRQSVIDYLDFSKSKLATLNFTMIFWNFIPIILLLFIIIFRTKSFKDPLFWMNLICLGRIPILFLTEPGSYFMYYYPTYLAGIFVIIIYVLDRTKARKEGLSG